MISTNAGAVPARARLLLSPLVLICILGIGRHAAPQTTGSILGNVSDPSGAVVVNAKVMVKCTQGGLTRTAVSNASGSYILPQLPLGSYTLTVEGPGFEKYVNTAVMVDGDQNARIDAMLLPGKITDQVTVSGAPPQVDTHSNMLSVIIPQELVKRDADQYRAAHRLRRHPCGRLECQHLGCVRCGPQQSYLQRLRLAGLP